MGKIVLFWLLIVLSGVILFGGGASLFFWIHNKAKKAKLF